MYTVLQGIYTLDEKVNDKPESKEPKTISEKTEGMVKHDGFYSYYWDEKEGKIWLEVDKLDYEFLYWNALRSGLGSNDVGLDRNNPGRGKIVKFQRIGPKILLVLPNPGYYASSDNVNERKAVEDAFATSVMWAFKVEAEEDDKALVDMTDFILSDQKDVVSVFKRRNQGDYELDTNRSAIYLDSTKNFPKNTVFEAIQTYKSKNPGDYVASVSPDAKLVTLRTHHSFIELPDDDYTPRVWDPRSMFGAKTYMDYHIPVDQNLKKRYITRHRLKKKDPNEEMGEPVEPIVYYIDNAAPEPILSALVEGASWWNEAFEVAGYKNAFEAKVLPDGADPLDIRYNIINWVHRSSRGWSYGMGVTDPRTGEIMKGQVALGSLRIRHDFNIATGLVGCYNDGTETSKMLEMGLARIRQLSVHEVGHTLGVGHNYASHWDGRSSVMDYPAMWAQIDNNGDIDISEAYARGVGEWDKVYTNFGYRDYPEGVDEEAESRKILDKAFEGGLLYVPGQDSGPGGANPQCAPWINGKDAVDELERMMKVRHVALSKFDERKLKPFEPMALLEDVLVPIYLFHRYQTEAACSKIGGSYYFHTIRGDTQPDPKMVPGEEQKYALERILMTVHPDNLAVPAKVLEILPPRLSTFGQNRDQFPGRTGYVFDAMGAAETAANMTLSRLLHPQRATRLMEQHARNPDIPGLGEVIDEIVKFTWKKTYDDGYHAELGRLTGNIALYHMIQLASNCELSASVRSMAYLKLDELKDWCNKTKGDAKNAEYKAQYLWSADLIDLYQENPEAVKLTPPLPTPQGPPI